MFTPRAPFRRLDGARSGAVLARSMATIVVAMLVTAGLGGCGLHLPTAAHRTHVILYGDSLADESRHWFEASFPSAVRVESHVLGGTAICDFLPQMAADLARLKPVAVVFEFSGNSVTPCTQPAPGTAASRAQLDDRYRQDAATATRMVVSAGAAAWWMGAPANQDPNAEIGNHDIRVIYAALPQQFANTHYVDAGLSVERDGQFTATLPCLPEEPCSHINGDQNQVRASDGGHLCPVHQFAVDTCPVWSSGAYRFGRAMADPVIASLHLRPARLSIP